MTRFLSASVSAAALSLILAAPGMAQTAAPDAAPAETPAAEAPAAGAPATDAPVTEAPAAEAPASETAAPAAEAAAADAAAAPPAPEATPVGQIGGTYVFDPEHSQIVFSYDHMGFSTSHGFVNGVTGQVTLDEENPANSTVEAQFPLSALRTVTPALDEHLFSDDFFKGAASDTLVTFRSTSVAPKDDDEAEVTGDLTLNGVTKPVTLDVDLNKAAANPMSGKPAVGFEIEGTIRRSDFNLGAFVPAVSDEVKLEIAVEAAKE